MSNIENIKKQFQIIANLFKAKKYNQAISSAKKLLKSKNNNEFLVNIIGLSYLNIGYFIEANNHFHKFSKMFPNIISYKNNYANALKANNNFDEAEKILESLLEQKPDYLQGLNNLANLKKSKKKYHEAIDLLKKGLEIDANNILIIFNLIVCYQTLRKTDKVIENCKKIIQLDPKFTRADKIMSGIYNYNKEGKKHFFEMLSKLNNLDLSIEEESTLSFAIGKAYEDQKDYKSAFENYEKANNLKNKSIVYDFETDKQNFEFIMKVNSSDDFNNLDAYKDQEKKIIFVCGMPRSGTTLLEQIISTHSEIKSAGETNYLFKSLNSIEGFKECNDEKFIKSIKDRNIYKDVISQFSKLDNYNKIITDKSLINYKLIGFIRKFFPGSRVLILKRDLNNNLLSIFKNDLETFEMKWTYNLKNIVNNYNLFIKYTDHWKKLYPGIVMEVKYEDLIENTEDISKKIMNFCNISWEKECLEYYKYNPSPIETLSANQANKPIYSKSKNNFLNFKDFIKI